MRRRARVDANHAELRDGLRRIPGCTVEDLSDVGRGVSDLMVGYKGRIYLLEIKDGSKPPSARKLTDDEVEFSRRWSEHYFVVCSLDDARRVLGVSSSTT